MLCQRTVILIAFATLYVYFASLQFNDADSEVWVSTYGVAAIITLLCAFVPSIDSILPLGHALFCTMYALLILCKYIGLNNIGFYNVGSIDLNTLGDVEEVREIAGLMMVVTGMIATSRHVPFVVCLPMFVIPVALTAFMVPNALHSVPEFFVGMYNRICTNVCGGVGDGFVGGLCGHTFNFEKTE